MKYLSVSCLLLFGGSWLAAEPAPASKGVPRPQPVTPPIKADVLDAAIKRGVAFLVKDQNKDGSWGTPHRTKSLNIYAPVPGSHDAFRGAVTSLCVSALIEAGGNSPEVVKAIERGEVWIMVNLPKLRRPSADALYNVWGHCYAIQALVRMHERLPKDSERRQKIVKLIQEQMSLLGRYESVDGGWGYYDMRVHTQKPSSDSMSFVNGAVLVAFHEAKQIGVEPPPKLVQRAVAATVRQRLPDFSYLYGEYLKWRPAYPINRAGGSLGRSQCCNLALKLWGDTKITDQVLTTWLDRLIVRNGWLSMGRKKPKPHESFMSVAGYFYYFGHYYAALVIDQLPKDQRPFYQDHLANLLLPLQEKDGTWWDFPLYNYHFQYGTAFALMSLQRCRK